MGAKEEKVTRSCSTTDSIRVSEALDSSSILDGTTKNTHLNEAIIAIIIGGSYFYLLIYIQVYSPLMP